MSSRAIRKEQRKREELQKLQEQNGQQDQDEEDDEDGEEQELIASQPSKQSLFALLGTGEEDEEESDGDSTVQQDLGPSLKEETTSSAPKRKKKKKSKKAKAPFGANEEDADLDEIDRALKQLAVDPSAKASGPSQGSNPDLNALCSLLSVESAHLHAENEVRRLFGRAALDHNDGGEDAAGAGRGRRQRGQQAAGSGRRDLASIGLRRNIFIQGKEEWPRATSGGLSMEVVSALKSDTVEYRFAHSSNYQEVQRKFEAAIAAMDPRQLLAILQSHPYHIGTLLQASEIGRIEREHSAAGDFLERALFCFGRSVQSTFPKALNQGTARLDFARPENREFWLAGWRYINNLSMRGTWRTVFEWTKLLLSLDPRGDPYCMCLVIDQYALRAGQARTLINLSENSWLARKWKSLPNIQMSKALALIATGQTSKGRQLLYQTVGSYPWVAARLFQELDLGQAPPTIWGKTPRNDKELLYTELYATRAKDIWNTPDNTSLLVEIASSISSDFPATKSDTAPINIDEARHTILTENSQFIKLIPSEMTADIGSSSDPLPPPESLQSYATARPARATLNESPATRPIPASPAHGLLQEIETLEQYMNSAENLLGDALGRQSAGSDPHAATVEDDPDSPEERARRDLEETRRSGRPAAQSRMISNVRRYHEIQSSLMTPALSSPISLPWPFARALVILADGLDGIPTAEQDDFIEMLVEDGDEPIVAVVRFLNELSQDHRRSAMANWANLLGDGIERLLRKAWQERNRYLE